MWSDIAVQTREPNNRVCHGTNRETAKSKSTIYKFNHEMSHQPTLFIDQQIFPLLLNHFGCQFCSFATDIGSETRPLSNNITLYYTGEEGRGGEGGKKEEGKG